jgi:hypothetical protein
MWSSTPMLNSQRCDKVLQTHWHNFVSVSNFNTGERFRLAGFWVNQYYKDKLWEHVDRIRPVQEGYSGGIFWSR